MLDQAELTRIYRSHGAQVFRRARRLLGSEADAGEIVQEVFLSLFENPAQFAGRSSLTTFLYGATTNACLNRLRNQRGRARLRQERAAELEPQAAEQLLPDQLLLLHTTLQSMPRELAQVAIYHYMDGMTRDEIAEIIGRSRRHIGNQLLRLQRWVSEREALG
jgi:RNA polymerase sigma-70 factor (ECF subfamily)